MWNKIILITIFILTIIPIVSATSGHLTLLTVGESGNETVGGTADLFLEIKPGSGRVFIDSFPLTKVDTQISTRFAKDVSCNFLEMDCSNKDFFYTIRANAPIVGGPSAGSAITVLTIALLDNLKLDEKTVMTGTINSGGLIGPVAGIKEKAEAARRKGFKKVLVPKWSIIINESEIINESDNESLNKSYMYADSLKVTGIEIKTISTIEEALEEFTGKKFEKYNYPIKIPDKYNRIMKKVANQLCDRYDSIMKNISKEKLIEKNSTINITNHQAKLGLEALETEDYYSAASYCFTANSGIKSVELYNQSNESLRQLKNQIKSEVNNMLLSLDAMKLKTMSDLETYIIVKDRLYETKTLLKENESQIFKSLGYINERFYSAVAWSEFFEYNEKTVNINEEYLANACLAKLSEAEERNSYVNLLFGDKIPENKQLQQVKEIYASGDYAFCLFKASKLKADSDALLSTIAITHEKLPELISDKLTAGKTSINKQGDTFPILGYSYYNYASSLKENEPMLAVIFSEYTVELSNLDMYFPKEKKLKFDFDYDYLAKVGIGFGLGIIFSLIVLSSSKKTSNKKKHSKER